MGRKFTLIKDYYDGGFDIYKKKSITINPGVTVLVGCNGIGKTTLLHQIESDLKKNNIPYSGFDNLHDGGSNAVSEASYHGDLRFLATAIQSSEGENIIMNMGYLASMLKEFIRDGKEPKGKRWSKFVKNTNQSSGNEVLNNPKDLKERWILLDAIDSGLSVDNIVNIKEQLFKTILKYNYGNEIYIIVSANEYEMARGEQCFDVYNGRYVSFKDYEGYRDFVIQSKEWKSQRNVK